MNAFESRALPVLIVLSFAAGLGLPDRWENLADSLLLVGVLWLGYWLGAKNVSRRLGSARPAQPTASPPQD